MIDIQESIDLSQKLSVGEDTNKTLERPTKPLMGHGVLRCTTFIDGSWLYHNQEMLVRAFGGPYKIDFSKINLVALKFLRQHYANMFGMEGPMLDLVRTYYYASVPANVHPNDQLKLEDQRKFYTMLSDSLGFELIIHEIDFRGHFMAMQDRIELENEPNFLPKERTVDMALGINMLYLAAINAYDIAIAVLGDADYQPALDRVRQLGKRILIFTIGGSAAYDYLYPKPTSRFSDFPVIRFQDYLEDLRLSPRTERERPVFAYTCAKCGKVFESTYKAAPKQNMYCDEHRIWRDRNNNNHVQATEANQTQSTGAIQGQATQGQAAQGQAGMEVQPEASVNAATEAMIVTPSVPLAPSLEEQQDGQAGNP